VVGKPENHRGLSPSYSIDRKMVAVMRATVSRKKMRMTIFMARPFGGQS
jgi:hypothetical protein